MFRIEASRKVVDDVAARIDRDGRAEAALAAFASTTPVLDASVHCVAALIKRFLVS